MSAAASSHPSVGLDRLQGWEEYPNTRVAPNTFSTQSTQLKQKLNELGPRLFSGDVDLRIFDVAGDGTLHSWLFPYEDAAQVETQLMRCESEKPRVRIISLHSSQSIQGLDVTGPLLRKILTYHAVNPAFLHILFSFGCLPRATESGARNIFHEHGDDGSHTLAYQVRYVEETPQKPKKPFSRRQTGIYHHHDAAEDFDLFIFLNPVDDSLLEIELTSMLQTKASALDICESPFRLHLLPFALYVDNWRWNLQYLGEQLDKEQKKIMTLDLHQSATVANVNLSFEKVQALHKLEDDTLLMNGHCEGAISVLETMQQASEDTLTGHWSTASYIDRLQGYDKSLQSLMARVRSSINLHAYALDLKNQLTAANTNEHVSVLAEETGRDTTAVKWITYLTLIYLPGTFVATLYGMNLFLFSPESRRLIIAKDFWIFAATWLPLTFITFSGYYMMQAYHRTQAKTSQRSALLRTVKCISGP